MTRDRVQLPKDQEALARILEAHAKRERMKMIVRFTLYKVMAAYLAGARNFYQFDVQTGQLMYSWVDKEGNLEFQGSDLLAAYNQILGQLSSADYRPRVEASGQTLQAVRHRALAQIVSDSLFSEEQIEKVANEFTSLYVMLGRAGITSHVLDHPSASIGLTADLEVIHPRELFPFPTVDEDYTKAFGMMRERPVSMEHLKDIFGARKIKALQDKLYWEQRVIGETPHQPTSAMLPQGMQVNLMDGNTQPGSASEEMEGYAIVRELWLEGPRETCSRYIVQSGDAILADEDYKGVEKYCPIGTARFMDNHTWYGAGVWDLMWAVCRQLELMVKALFNNVRDIDRYGFLVMPQGTYNQQAVFKEIARGLRVLPWESDALGGDNFKPFMVQPYNSGDVPGKTAAFAQQYLASLNPIRDILREKGRVDSAQGLAFLDESARRALTTPTQGLQRAWGQNYRAAVASGVAALTQSPRALPVNQVNLKLAGAIIDWDKNEVSFAKNPIPTVSRLKFTIKEASPGSEVARIQMARELVKEQITTPDKVILKAVEEGWDLPIWLEDVAAAVATFTRQFLTLYNDGVSPGQMISTPFMSRPDIQIVLLKAAMSDLPMMVASVDVQDEMTRWLETLTEWSGRSLPDGLPYNPDDAAVAQSGLQGAIQSLPPQIAAAMQAAGGQQPQPAMAG